MKFIDLHGHYAWQIDDGMKNVKETIKALSMAKKQGVKMIVATPHIICKKTKKQDIVKIKERIQELKELAKSYGIKVVSGCELMLNSGVKEMLDHQLFIPFEDTKYLLCEYNVRKSNDEFLEVFDLYIKEVIFQGYKPIVAHVERYFHEDIDLDYVAYLIELGCVIQVNTTSILGKGHEKHHENAMRLLDSQMVHVIATDSHTASGARSPNMKPCYEYLYREGYDQDYIELLMYNNPRSIIQNKEIKMPNFKNTKILNKLMRKFGRKK